MTDAPLAHSAPEAERAPHLYREHVAGVTALARANAEAVARFMPETCRACFVCMVEDAATFHDLGKLDPDNQAGLRQGRSGRLPWDHVDAGVAHLLRAGAEPAAWMVRAHHALGLPAHAAQFNVKDPGAVQGLRGGRVGDRDRDQGDAVKARTNVMLDALLAAHKAEAGDHAPRRSKEMHGLWLRLALSCLVDGDHADAGAYEHGHRPPEPPAARWQERLAALDAYMARLPRGGARQADRDAFYAACRNGSVEAGMAACEGAVGIGKTTAVMAWCLRRAIRTGARRIVVVAPYTTILTQTAATLRAALALPDEDAGGDEIVAEHHHRADFQALASRDLAVLWRAPIVLTTSVQLFETLAACDPARLRKLHGLPGSVLFVDEAHAALPAPLWRQNWAWMRELAERWGCSFVFASGSLARVWADPDIVGDEGVTTLPDLAPPELAARLDAAEHARVRYRTLGRIADPVAAVSETPGPRLAVFNTVQTAAVIASRLRNSGTDVLHLSTALSPVDRERILEEVQRRLQPQSGYASDWTLVSTSLVEAGLDLSFRTALRESFSVASLVQIGGRVNRHGGPDDAGGVIDLRVDHDGETTPHPSARRSAAVLESFFRDGRFAASFNPASVVSQALREELLPQHGQAGLRLVEAEAAWNYPLVAREGRLIDSDTVLAVVDPQLCEALEGGETVPPRRLLGGSVQIWRTKSASHALRELKTRPGVYVWPYAYDPSFLGYMAGVLAFDPPAAWIC